MTSEEKVYHPHVVAVTNALVSYFGRSTLGNKRKPVDELLFIILSSKTPPDRYQEVYQSLRNHYPIVDYLAEADWTEVAQVIGRAGLQNRKAKAMVEIARRLKDKFGKVTLSPLKQMPDHEIEGFLTSLPEVSLKKVLVAL